MTRSQPHLLFLLALPLRLGAVWAPERHRLRRLHVAQASQHPAAHPVPDGQQIGDDDLRHGGEQERYTTAGETLRAIAANESSDERAYARTFSSLLTNLVGAGAIMFFRIEGKATRRDDCSTTRLELGRDSSSSHSDAKRTECMLQQR